jgi:hypothetical protein
MRKLAGKRPLTGKQLSDFRLLGHLERVVYSGGAVCSDRPL